MKIEVGKVYTTRDGSKVRVVSIDTKDEDNLSLFVGLLSVGNMEVITLYTADGHCYSDKEHDDRDIIAEYSFWNDVEVDTPILIKDGEGDYWYKGYFAKYEDGKVYAWFNGTTSWSVGQQTDIEFWNYAKLAEDEDENNI